MADESRVPEGEDTDTAGHELEVDEEGGTIEEDARPAGRLSTTSKLYDRHNKGYLDPAESEMRKYDSKNQGFLDNNKIHKIVEDKIQTEKRLSNFKKLAILFACLSVLLAISNIGTAYLAVKLQKDTETDSEARLITTDTGEIVKTQGVGQTFTFPWEWFVSTGDGYLEGCVRVETIAALYSQIGSGTKVSVKIESADGTNAVLLSYESDGIIRNSTHVCIPRSTTGTPPSCFRFDSDRCGIPDDGAEADNNEIAARRRRQLFDIHSGRYKLDHHSGGSVLVSEVHRRMDTEGWLPPPPTDVNCPSECSCGRPMPVSARARALQAETDQGGGQDETDQDDGPRDTQKDVQGGTTCSITCCLLVIDADPNGKLDPMRFTRFVPGMLESSASIDWVQDLVTDLDGNLDGSFTQFAEPLLSNDDCDSLIQYTDQLIRENVEEGVLIRYDENITEDFWHPLSAANVEELLPFKSIQSVYNAFKGHDGSYKINSIHVRRTSFPDKSYKHIPFHQDGKASVLIVPLNDSVDGGDIFFLDRNGRGVMSTKVGTAGVMSDGLVHGVNGFAGTRYVLIVAGSTLASSDILEGIIKDHQANDEL